MSHHHTIRKSKKRELFSVIYIKELSTHAAPGGPPFNLTDACLSDIRTEKRAVEFGAAAATAPCSSDVRLYSAQR